MSAIHSGAQTAEHPELVEQAGPSPQLHAPGTAAAADAPAAGATLHADSGQRASPPPSARPAPNLLRRVLMLGGTALVLGVAGTLYLLGGRHVGTDDAYVKAAQLSVTTDVSGIVESVHVREGQHVRAGDVLFRIDAQPFRIALANAEAALVQARMTVGSLKADYRQSLQQVRAQEAQVDVARKTLERFEALAERGAIARTLIDQQRATYLSAVATLDSLRQSAAADLARLGGNPDLPTAGFPDEMKARAAIDEAKRQIDHTIVRAPFDGIVTAVGSLQPGTLIISAMSAFSTTSAVGLVAERGHWVEANMKETDLTRVHAGQPVDVTIDTYPDCRWTGTIDAVSAASGAAFSPLPAQNTSGNWVKVVQRIPVKVRLVKASCDVRLSAGMSAIVSIDTGHDRWYRLTHG
jgi:membrane fusion protein (multidrug efflux system)